MISRISLPRHALVIPFYVLFRIPLGNLQQFVWYTSTDRVLFDAKYKGSSANAKLGVGSKRPSLHPWLHNALYNYKATTWCNSTSGL